MRLLCRFAEWLGLVPSEDDKLIERYYRMRYLEARDRLKETIRQYEERKQ